ncbi:hypothetical protein AB0M46_37965 [Dactylosporangium sp. NPDC051485]|uniref:hypothetical protein n=1 Tax=Dactylosporangium sp. NPDC051485 TaxID=3154846 RepID=UPI00341C8B28
MIRIPAGQVAAGHLPPVCPRHGEHALEMKKLRLISKPPSWAAVLILLGGIVYLIVVMALRKTVHAAAWPWCEQCKAARSRNLGIGLGVLGLGLLLIVVGIATIDGSAGPLLFLVGLVALVVGIVFAARGGAQAVSGAFVSQDGNFVEIAKDDPRFGQALGGRQAQYR